MNKLVLASGAALILSGLCCLTGAGAASIGRRVGDWERAVRDAEHDKRRNPRLTYRNPPRTAPPQPVYAVAGAKPYKYVTVLCLIAAGGLLLTGLGTGAVVAFKGPPLPAPGQGVVCRRNPTWECGLFLPLGMGGLVMLGGLASSNPAAAALPGVALVGFVVLLLLVLHAGTARVADTEGVTLGFGRRFLWADFVGSDDVTEYGRTRSGDKVAVGSYYRLRFKRGSFKLRSHRFSNWDEVWAFIQARMKPPTLPAPG